MKVFQIVALTANGKLWQSDICYKSYEQAELQRKELLKDFQNIAYCKIKELVIF